MKAIVATIAAVAALSTAGAAAAQDWSIRPNYGSVTLRSGFTPDPHTVNLTAGGNIDVSYSVSSECRGYVSNAPDYELIYTASSNFPLIISANSSSDTTLVVNGPDGRWYCDDDGGNQGLNPSISWSRPQSGAYHIWVGTYGSSLAPATLAISELNSY
jgi:hypothetical protein